MNLVIRAHGSKDEAALQPLVGHFDERGGTIGRSETNTLTLPDPNRHISRLQAEVAFSAGTFTIRNVGSAKALLVDGRPVGPGESVAVGHGDELAIGSYVLRVSIDGAGNSTQAGVARQAIDPRSVIKASLMESRTNPRLRPEPASAITPAAPRAAAPDPNPFADLFGVAAAAPGPTSPVDPFADLLDAPAPLPPAPASTADLGELLGHGPASTSLDRLFDLSSDGKADPLAAFLAAGPRADSGKAIGTDPLAMFGLADSPDSAQGISAAFDHVPELQGAYAPPVVKAAAERVGRVGQATPQPDTRSLDLELPGPTTPRSAAPQAPIYPEGPSNEDLWHAFCEGAGIPVGQPRALDANFMRQLGEVLHHAVDGSLKLMKARAAVKQELRADVTIIQSRNNNPLKFSPDAPAAIEQLLSVPLRGFMPGPAAMQDAMADLLGHAMGTMVGMRAALHGVLQRFEPAQLEHKLGAHKVLDALLPTNRRAKLWEQYLLHFERIRNDAQEDFHELFGKAFVEAYEEQLGKLKADRR